MLELLSAENYSGVENSQVELQIAGRISDLNRARWDDYLKRNNLESRIEIRWMGQVPQEIIPEIDRSAHMLYSGDINPACPNSVIEALACGLPVVSFDTGAIPEMVVDNAGIVVSYGGDPWALDKPDIPSLSKAAAEIYNNQANFRRGARQRAVDSFDLDHMLDSYLAVIANY